MSGAIELASTSSGIPGSAWRIGRVCWVYIYATANLQSSYASAVVGTLPEGWRPSRNVVVPVSVQDCTGAAHMIVSTSGSVTVQRWGGGGNLSTDKNYATGTAVYLLA